MKLRLFRKGSKCSIYTPGRSDTATPLEEELRRIKRTHPVAFDRFAALVKAVADGADPRDVEDCTRLGKCWHWTFKRDFRAAWVSLGANLVVLEVWMKK